MTDPRSPVPGGLAAPRQAIRLLAASVLLTTGAAVLAQPAQPARPTSSAAAPQSAGVKAPRAGASTATISPPNKPEEKPKPRGPRQLAEQIIPVLKKQKTPWPIYADYARIYDEFAAAEQKLAAAAGNTPAGAARNRLALHLQQMATALRQMGTHAKTRQDIQRGLSDVAPEARQSTFVQAGKDHQEALNLFVRQAAALPAEPRTPASR